MPTELDKRAFEIYTSMGYHGTLVQAYEQAKSELVMKNKDPWEVLEKIMKGEIK